MLEIKELTYAYPRSAAPVFSGLDLTLHHGGIYGMLGSNGAGKSTLLYLMCGLLLPSAGSVYFKGENVGLRHPLMLADIFIVPEEFDLPHVSLEEFVRVNAEFYPRFSREDMNRYLEEFRLNGALNLGRLSMGQKKKVFISFALACNTSLLLMDEPTNGLDIPGKSEFRRALVAAMTDERTVVISTHQVRDLDRVLDQVVIVDGGKPVLQASMTELQRSLAFTVEPQPDNAAIYCQPTVGGYAIVRAADSDSAETDVNLESLFELAVTSPAALTSILKK
ncbi:MAG: ABC transporter ATP-binding protein [Muribaculaceae bacterium]|nr:ABC transporter ATP-binding protein [Muribaculaceae bacterium]